MLYHRKENSVGYDLKAKMVFTKCQLPLLSYNSRNYGWERQLNFSG